MGKSFCLIIIPAGLIIGLPLLGVLFTGNPVLPYLAFPPKGVITPHPSFSLPVFLIFLMMIIFTVLPFLKKGFSHKGKTDSSEGRFPWWGKISVTGLAFFWIMAWTRLDWFDPFQAHTFFPLWACWIVSVNALVFRSKKNCPLLSYPLRFLFLFLVSAVFWWLFEYLNRFVGNWYYSGSQYPAFQYFLLATLSFSTVLPAVESMKEYLLTFDKFKSGFKKCVSIKCLDSKPFAILMVVISGFFLFLVSVFPNALFFLIWICPFFIFTGCQIVYTPHHVFADTSRGDFTKVAAYATAALICGFFWEMFNMYSLAGWQYAIPYVDVFHLFEMPILGYAGYLPFGLECAVIIDLVMKKYHQ